MSDREPGRYAAPGRHPARDDADYWIRNARLVVLDLLATEYAVTTSEMEARTSDRTWKPQLCPYPIEPHWLVNARADLLATGTIELTSEPTRSHPDPIITWSLPIVRGQKRRIEDAAQRKRLLAARHNGWSQRGGAGIGLIGRAGEDALHATLTAPDAPITRVTGSTEMVLGVDLHLFGDIDNSGFYVDTSDPTHPQLVMLLFEVKNTRNWYYVDNDELRVFLRKAAIVQRDRPDQLILPVFVCRRWQYSLWRQGERDGFLPVRVENQLVLPDNELTEEVLNEVRVELGYADLRLGSAPTNRHLGMVRKSIPRRAVGYARRWAHAHAQYL